MWQLLSNHPNHLFFSLLHVTDWLGAYLDELMAAGEWSSHTIVKFTQLCNKFPPTALMNFACDWLALYRDISFGRLTSPNV